jgi:nicotinate-nucleotide adenylyltransferase
LTVTRLGVFGGAFDPPHRAHRALAQAAVEQLRLHELRIFPTGQAWHKPRALTAGEHRLAMARLAFDGLPHVEVDDREMRRAGATYTIDTLRELHGENPGAELFLLMGADQAEAFTTWRDWQAIAGLATLAVAQRPGSAAARLPPQVRWQALAAPSMDVSASAIRARLAAGEAAIHLVDPPVARYIDQHHLYSDH